VVKGQASIKDTLEALGIPHTEIERMVVNGRKVNFTHRMKEVDNVLIYPHGTPKNQGPFFLKPAKFACDVHLGKLARHLRLMRLDTIYKINITDQELFNISQKEKRVLLTRDIGILKNNRATRAFFVYNTSPEKQWKEIIKRFKWSTSVKPFSRCLECNGKIKRTAKSKVLKFLPLKVQKFYKMFYQCADCRKIYWQGSHYQKLLKMIKK